MKTSVAAALGATVPGVATAAPEDPNTASAPVVQGEIKRFATTAYGAEVTGPFVFDEADGVPNTGLLIFSLQHPASNGPTNRDEGGYYNEPDYQKGAIGYVEGFSFTADGASDEFAELPIPKTREESARVRTAAGDYSILAREKQTINGGDERLGVPKLQDGTPITEFAGSKYSAFGNDPDMNQFVPDESYRTSYNGYLYTNFEQSPGTLTRMPVTVTAQGDIQPDIAETTNLSNYTNLRELGGTRINCYGDLSPWGTPLSAEEEYSHPRVSLTGTVSEMVEKGGVGRRGAAEFYNRPNPTGIQGKVGEYYDSGWYVQGYFALAGLELQAYYLGATQDDQDGGKNTLAPIKSTNPGPGNVVGNYPNRYRYGYIVDFRNPAAMDPSDVEPVKYWVMGRGAWEAPDVQSDERTFYLCSDGSNKGIYKFVADDAISNYGPGAANPLDDLSGTLYAPKVTNATEVKGKPPGEVNLRIEWIELGSATNGEVEGWIEQYDGIDQTDYLKSHSDWTEGDEVTAAVLEQADREVVESGNKDYITDREILDWAEAKKSGGSVPDDLRKVPFLETRAAARELGATIEFRKAEGIDSRDDAGPGDYVYVGLSEVNDGLADEEGDLRFERVDGGMVYRAELDSDYDISTLEPVIVGPDASDPAQVADDALLNVDNVYVLNDGRVICCEDADQLGRSYPNDGMYVYTPESATKTDTPGDSPATGRGKGR